jgi:hypothetical protein
LRIFEIKTMTASQASVRRPSSFAGGGARGTAVIQIRVRSTPFSGRIASSRRFGRERREFAGGRRPDRALPRSSCLARCLSCGGAALPRRYVSRWGERGPLYLRATSGRPPLHVTRRRPSPKSSRTMPTRPCLPAHPTSGTMCSLMVSWSAAG